ncbi:ornithine cyclodeaminase [Ornithinimicrobium sufpigmenti]|uniref:ornithine cyclodeaminase n=1 Tax=Ornithinimicrobium sufpigmenti TaxID=2508882 RepID=UPI001036BCEF|nr:MULTISPECIES: ornithine cyclodeaminase [unclassified Ornithinimicrobium]
MITATDIQPLHISSEDIAQHVSWPLAIKAARVAALAAIEPDVELRRATLPIPGGWMRLMAASVPSAGVFGYKEFHLTADKSVRYCIKLFDVGTGRPLGIIDAALVTTLRTAATAAVAVEQIIGTRAPVRLAVVGSGAEALAGLEALHEVLSLESVTVTSRSAENRAAFVASARERTGLDVVAHASLAGAVQSADLVYSATNSGGRIVIDEADVASVPVIASIGSTLPNQRELGGRVLTTADRIVVDTDEVFDESGDALEAIALGLDRNRGEMLGHALFGTTTPDRGIRTVYKSIGSPLQDLILGAAIIEAAEQNDFGRRIDPLSAVKVNL